MKGKQDTTDVEMMALALIEAKRSAENGEVPVGAVLIDNNGEIIASAGNSCIKDNNPVGHAEIKMLQLAAGKINNYRLPGTTAYVTLEPCAMCAAALVHARVKRIVYGADDLKTGAIASKYQIGSDGLLNHSFEITSGVLRQECSQVLKDFFKSRR